MHGSMNVKFISQYSVLPSCMMQVREVICTSCNQHNNHALKSGNPGEYHTERQPDNMQAL